MDSSNVSITSGPIFFEQVNIFEKMFNVHMAHKNIVGNILESLLSKGNPLLNQVISAPMHKLILEKSVNTRKVNSE